MKKLTNEIMEAHSIYKKSCRFSCYMRFLRQAWGVSLVSYSEAFDSSTPLGTVAQFEREVISENISMALLERARQGKQLLLC